VNDINLNKIQKNVLDVCTRYPEAVDNRNLLLERYWIEYDFWQEDKSLYWNLQRSTRPETIVRRLREIREMGLVEHSLEVAKKNIQAMKNERDRVKYLHSQVKSNAPAPKFVMIDGEQVAIL